MLRNGLLSSRVPHMTSTLLAGSGPAPSSIRKRLLPATVLFLVAVGWSFMHFHAQWRHADRMIIGGREGDAMKNSYTFAWHVSHDTSALHFNGAHFPFGDHITYPDAQPLLSNTLRAASIVAPSLRERPLSIMNRLLLLAPIFSALCFYLLLLELGMERWPSVPMALAAMSLDPQLLRSVGHFGLAYGAVIPGALVLLVRSFRNDSYRRWAIAFGAWILAATWVHVYLGVVAWSFSALVAVGLLIVHRDRSWWHSGALAIMLAAPMLIFLLVQWITDTHAGRTDRPIGFFLYQSSLGALIHPFSGLESPLVRQLFGTDQQPGWEGMAYIGLACVVSVGAGSVVSLVAWMRRRASPLPIARGTGLVIILASLPLLFLAMGYPFNWDLHACVWRLPGLAQFRSIGRFAWPFYWAAMLMFAFGSMALWHWRRDRLRVLTRGFVLLAFLVTLYEGHYYTKGIACFWGTQPTPFLQENLSGDEHRLVEVVRRLHPRALIPLPWFHRGSDDLQVECPPEVEHAAMILAYHTATPLLANVLPKVSVLETRDLINLMGPPWYAHPISNRLPRGDYLVLAMKAWLKPIDSTFLARCQPLLDLEDRSLWRITSEALLAFNIPEIPEGKQAVPFEAAIYQENWDNLPSRHVHRGAGALELPRCVDAILWQQPAATLRQGARYVASFWYHIGPPMHTQTLVAISEGDTKVDKVQWRDITDVRFTRVIDADWCMVEVPFMVTDSTHVHSLILSRTHWFTDTVRVDDLLVHEAGQVVSDTVVDHRTGGVQVRYNGHWFDPLICR